MDARLPVHPNLGFYRKSAKELKRALAAGDPGASARFARHPKARRASDVTLGDAQLVIALEHGFSSWSEFKAAVARAALEPSPSPSDRLLEAVRAGDAGAVRELCATRPELARAADSKGALPLVEAADRGALEIARVLLDAGADPRAGDPLLFAAHAGPHKRGPALSLVELLIERGAPNDVFTHAMLGRTDELRRELSSADVDARGPGDSSALFLAAWNGQPEAVRLLLEAGADPNPIGRGGQSAWQVVRLHLWSAPHREVARLLLDRGAPCSLDEACVLSHLPSVRRLLAADPDLVDRPNEAGVTPLLRAILNADVDLARVLLDAGAVDPHGLGQALVQATSVSNRSFARALHLNCSFREANFHDCTLENAVFSDVNLAGVRIDNANLSGAHIDNALIEGLTIYGIEIEPLLRNELDRRAAARGTPR